MRDNIYNSMLSGVHEKIKFLSCGVHEKIEFMANKKKKKNSLGRAKKDAIWTYELAAIAKNIFTLAIELTTTFKWGKK